MTGSSEAKLEILADPEALARRVADWLLAEATVKDGVFAVALSGGSTPRRLYQLLAGPPYRDTFPWSRTHWFWGDERFVPHDDALSNYRMAREALFSRAPIPAINIHPIPTEGVSPEAAASAYERELKSCYGAERLYPARPLFDVTLLGLGPDGHTASLFPGTSVLAERDRWVAAVVGAKSETRITLTYPALESSRYAAFLVAGEEKRAIFARFRRGDDNIEITLVAVEPVHDDHDLSRRRRAGREGKKKDSGGGREGDRVTMSSSEQDGPRRAAAARAVQEVEDGMVVGLGSGSTVAFAVEALAVRVAKGLRVVGIPTSEATAGLARRPSSPVRHCWNCCWFPMRSLPMKRG